jgi:hypothetical protein
MNARQTEAKKRYSILQKRLFNPENQQQVG